MDRTPINVPVAGGEIVGWVEGTGLPVLLLHGGPVGYEYLGGLAAEFLPGYAIAAYQQRGLPPELMASFDPHTRLRLPMVAGSRSLNLSNAVAVVVYEAWRQNGFAGMGS